MNQERLKLWTDALRSGKYKQTTGKLSSLTNEYCCLGVLCEVAIENGVSLEKQILKDFSKIAYDGNDGTLPRKVVEWIDHNEVDPSLNLCTCTDANDTHEMSFAEIADMLEEKYKED